MNEYFIKMREITRFFIVLLTIVMTNNILFGQSELDNFTKSETERSKLNKKELREYVSFLENISDSLLRHKSGTIVELQSQLEEKKKRIISIENEIVKLKTLQSKLESEKSELESEKLKLESEKSELENKLEKLSILISKNNEELNLLRKLNGIENDTTKNNQNNKEIGDGSVIRVGDLTLTPNGYKYQNKPYSGYLWNLKEGNYIEGFRQIRRGTGYNEDEKSELYFGMVKDGLKDGIWVESKNGWNTKLIKITKYEKGKINNGFTLEIDWDISYYLIKNKLRLNNLFDSLPDDFQFIEITENVEEQTDNITKNFKYECNKNYVEDRKMKMYFKSLNPQERIEFTKGLYKVICEELNKVENPTDLLIILNNCIKEILITNINHTESWEEDFISFKFDNYDMGKKNGLSIDSKLHNPQIIGYIPDHPGSEDVNRKESWTYSWDIDVSNYKNGELDSSSIKGKYNYIKDGTNRGVIKYDREIRFFDSVERTFEETSPNQTDITYFINKPDFIPINKTETYSTQNFKLGEKHGVQSYYKNGILTLKENYSNGELVEDREVYTDGIIQLHQIYENGILITQGHYKDGLLWRESFVTRTKNVYSNSSYNYFILKQIIYENGNPKETWFFNSEIRLLNEHNTNNLDRNTYDEEDTHKIIKH